MNIDHADSACPFCGSAPIMDTLKKQDSTIMAWSVFCERCCGRGAWKESQEEALAAWKARAAPLSAAENQVPRQEVPLRRRPRYELINKNLFYWGGVYYARNPHTQYCYSDAGDGIRRIDKKSFLEAYASCAKAARKI
jgi:hypothetical protein